MSYASCALRHEALMEYLISGESAGDRTWLCRRAFAQEQKVSRGRGRHAALQCQDCEDDIFCRPYGCRRVMPVSSLRAMGRTYIRHFARLCRSQQSQSFNRQP